MWGDFSDSHISLSIFHGHTRRYFSRRIGCYWPTDCPIYSPSNSYKKINSIISSPILFDEMLLLNILKDPFPSIKVKLCLEVSLPLERKIRKPTTTTTDQQIWTLSRVSTPPWLYATIPDPSQTFKGRNMTTWPDPGTTLFVAQYSILFYPLVLNSKTLSSNNFWVHFRALWTLQNVPNLFPKCDKTSEAWSFIFQTIP